MAARESDKMEFMNELFWLKTMKMEKVQEIMDAKSELSDEKTAKNKKPQTEIENLLISSNQNI